MKLRSHYFWLAIIALAIGFSSTAAHADVVYSLTGTNDGLGGDGLSVGFQFTTSSFITAPPLGTAVSTSQLTNCINCAVNSPIAAVFLPSAIIGSALVFSDVNNAASVYMFTDGAFSAPGTYHSGGLFSTGTLTVSLVSVPEPSTVLFSLLSLGLLGFVLFGRSRLAQVC